MRFFYENGFKSAQKDMQYVVGNSAVHYIKKLSPYQAT